MPVRPMETVEYYFGYLDKTIQLPKKAHENLTYILGVEKLYNKEATERVERIKKALEPLKLTTLNIEARPFKNLVEGLGSEMITPRNYITKEVIQVKAGTLDYVFFIGDFGTPEEAESYIINRLKTVYERRSGEKTRNKPRARIRLSREVIESVRAQFRKRKL